MPNWKWEVGEEKPFNPDEFYGGPSKSQRKRDMTALQKLGEQLVNESADRIQKAPLPEDLKKAVLECQRIKNREGRRRQLQYIGKVMRGLQETDIEGIRQQLDKWKGRSKADTALLHLVEMERAQLLETPNALTDFLVRFPQADSQQLRNLIRNAKKEQAENKPPKAFRELYKQIKLLVSEQEENTIPITPDTKENGE